MFANARASFLRDLLSSVVAAGIDYDNFAEASDGIQTTSKIFGLVICENDDGERFRHGWKFQSM
jgi:hypothetical protein